MESPILLSVPDTAHLLGVGRSTLYRLIDAGRLRTVKINNRTLFHRCELERFVKRLENETERPTLGGQLDNK